MFLTKKSFKLNKVFINETLFLENECPYKNGQKILIGNIYYEIIISQSKNKSKLFFKLKKFIPNIWHQYIDFIVIK